MIPSSSQVDASPARHTDHLSRHDRRGTRSHTTTPCRTRASLECTTRSAPVRMLFVTDLSGTEPKGLRQVCGQTPKGDHGVAQIRKTAGKSLRIVVHTRETRLLSILSFRPQRRGGGD